MRLKVLTQSWIDTAKQKTVEQLCYMRDAAERLIYADFEDEAEKPYSEQCEEYKVLKAKHAYLEKLIRHKGERPKSLHEMYENKWRDVEKAMNELASSFHLLDVTKHREVLDEARSLAGALDVLIYAMEGE